MSLFVVDASAWVEYFEGSPAGEQVKELIENAKHDIYTNLFTLAELSSYYHKKGRDFAEVRKLLISLSLIHFTDLSFVEEAGKLHAQMRKERKSISFGDVFVLLTARKLRAKIITKDDDFRGLPEAIIIR
ncbi:PIN domain-containing protein [Candidatus Woesearchaeota archaeon]|nr:PIN domain-containing protein [Candidatus Woesearchaeota archaeon]